MIVEAFAKVNFTLEVLGKRVDGYHALRSVVVPVSLSDSITLEPAPTITSDCPYPDDLCLKAALALSSYAGSIQQPAASSQWLLTRKQAPPLRQGRCREATEGYESSQQPVRDPKGQGVRISVIKRIPAGGGLGGGSADAAAVLLGLNRLWGLGLSPESLAQIGAEVGSDVPALVLAQHYRSPVLMEGRGELVRLLSHCPVLGDTIAEPPSRPQSTPIPLVLANPGVFSSTPEVFSRSSPHLPEDPSILYNMSTALASGEPARIAAALQNDLESPAISLHREIAAAKAALLEAGALGAVMSGSGSTVFGLVPSEARGREIAALLASQGLKAWSALACPVV